MTSKADEDSAQRQGIAVLVEVVLCALRIVETAAGTPSSLKPSTNDAMRRCMSVRANSLIQQMIAMRSAERETDVCVLGVSLAGSHGAWHVGSRHRGALGVKFELPSNDIALLIAEMPMFATQPEDIQGVWTPASGSSHDNVCYTRDDMAIYA